MRRNRTLPWCSVGVPLWAGRGVAVVVPKGRRRSDLPPALGRFHRRRSDTTNPPAGEAQRTAFGGQTSYLADLRKSVRS